MMRSVRWLMGIAIVTASLNFSGIVLADGWDPASRASNRDSIANTRHNLSLLYNIDAGGAGTVMDTVRNNYDREICIYCHTPHGANSQIQAPLWNRTVNLDGYEIFDKPRTLNRPIGQPSPNSLTCLSCHDGSISIDSILNMPGSGRSPNGGPGLVNNEVGAPNTQFLDSWKERPALGHFTMGPTFRTDDPTVFAQNGRCTLCHNSNNGTAMSNFRVFALGKDLRDDHPIGILFPTESFGANGVDFNEPTLIYTNNGGFSMRVFDFNGNSYPDKGEPRLYDTGEGFEVECASCHDPHGVPTQGVDSEFIPSFLRVSNGNANTGFGTSSGLCLTCHLK